MNVELARRAAACKHWRWMPGMAVAPSEDYREARIDALVWGHHFNLTIIPTEDGPVYAVCPHYGHEHYDSFPQPFSLPDLTDPATLGCLLHLVREAWEDQWFSCTKHGPKWEILFGKNHSDRVIRLEEMLFSSEAEALVAALEAAP
jgi:hypothetical protein